MWHHMRNTTISDYYVVCNISTWDKTKSPYRLNKGWTWTLIQRDIDGERRPAEWVKTWRLNETKRPKIINSI